MPMQLLGAADPARQLNWGLACQSTELVTSHGETRELLVIIIMIAHSFTSAGQHSSLCGAPPKPSRTVSAGSCTVTVTVIVLRPGSKGTSNFKDETRLASLSVQPFSTQCAFPSREAYTYTEFTQSYARIAYLLQRRWPCFGGPRFARSVRVLEWWLPVQTWPQGGRCSLEWLLTAVRGRSDCSGRGSTMSRDAPCVSNYARRVTPGSTYLEF
ncbi:hypothetical protein GY45DRAFT_506705 [Cubamyces sp. BRFM 1775]|nr:hypothetical protein GY45DRAFT_506705 [Cubamyces sp. BRFM 1775]